MWLLLPCNAGKNKTTTTKKPFCTSGNAWKTINRNNMAEGVKHHWWRWPTCRKHLPLVGFPRWARGNAAAGDGNTKHHFTLFRWLIGPFRPRSSGSDIRTGCELLIKYTLRLNINSGLPPPAHMCVVMLARENCNSQTKTPLFNLHVTTCFLLGKKSPVLESKVEKIWRGKKTSLGADPGFFINCFSEQSSSLSHPEKYSTGC